MKSQKKHHWFVKAQQDLSILTLFRGLKLSVTVDEPHKNKIYKKIQVFFWASWENHFFCSHQHRATDYLDITAYSVRCCDRADSFRSLLKEQHVHHCSHMPWIRGTRCAKHTSQPLWCHTANYNAQIFRSFFAVFFASLARFFKSFIVAMLQAHIPNAIHIPRFLSNSGWETIFCTGK